MRNSRIPAVLAPVKSVTPADRLARVHEYISTRLAADADMLPSVRLVLLQLVFDALAHTAQGGEPGRVPATATSRWRLGKILRLTNPSLYRALRQLAERGWIVRHPVPAAHGQALVVSLPWLADLLAEDGAA